MEKYDKQLYNLAGYFSWGSLSLSNSYSDLGSVFNVSPYEGIIWAALEAGLCPYSLRISQLYFGRTIVL